MPGMYEPLRLVSDTYPGVVPGVKAQGAMALLVAVSILWALIWLSYRAYQVCVTSNDALVDKLGLDIPPVPEVTLEDIGSRELRIAWKYPDSHNSIHKHVVQVNGVRIGESKRSETAVSILNLLPGHIYHLCVIAISAANFQTSSAILHVRTSLDPPQSEASGACGGPYIQAYAPRLSSLASPSAPVLSREQSTGPIQGKRTTSGRKAPTASASCPDHISQTTDDGKGIFADESEETVTQLAERLKHLQQENDTLDKQICQEDKEYETLLGELEDQRNELRQRVKEKDEASGDLRKHVNKLESVNRSAQSERSKREKLLQQKEAERKKRSEDMVRWDEGIAEMRKTVDLLQSEKAQVEEESAKRVEEHRTKIAHEQTEMKRLEEDIKGKGSRIKILEEERRRLEGGDNEETKELDRLERERDRRWEVKMANLRAQYTSLINVHTQAQQQYYEAQERLKWIMTQRSAPTLPYTPVPTLDLDMARRANSYRRSRHRSSLTSNVSSPLGYPVTDTTFQNQSSYRQLGTASPTVPPTSAFFNINNGMTIPDSVDQLSPIRTEPSNPPMSPRADALLPSDLLGDEDQLPSSPRESSEFPTMPVSAAPFQNFLPTSPSPVSSGSHPPSIFASPRESLVNLPGSERKSMQTSGSQAPSDAAQSASRRLSGLFGFHRQRGKTMADAPLLGSLKHGQSQSFPRNLDEELDPIGTRRRRLSYTSGWANPMAALFPRSSTANVTADSSSDRLPASRKAMFPSFFTTGKFSSSGSGTLDKSEPNTGYNQFSPSHDPIDPSIFGAVRRDSLSPRPASTYSFDKFLPRPTSDIQPFGWPASDMHRSSPLNVDWSTPGGAWSRSQSRRPSFQLGSSGHLPLALPPSDMDFLDTPYEPQRPVQAPIGTRPPSSHRPMTPKLNPAAPSFKTLFGKKSEKSKGKDADSLKARDEMQIEDTSPAESRRSRDARSIRTSAAESRESLERVSSGTPSEAISTKESFIQKITRKGSSSKFNMPWKDRASLFSKKGESTAQGDADDDGTSEMQLGKSIDSIASSAPSAERSTKSGFNLSFRRKPKKSDRPMSESSERASETDDNDAFEDA